MFYLLDTCSPPTFFSPSQYSTGITTEFVFDPEIFHYAVCILHGCSLMLPETLVRFKYLFLFLYIPSLCFHKEIKLFNDLQYTNSSLTTSGILRNFPESPEFFPEFSGIRKFISGISGIFSGMDNFFCGDLCHRSPFSGISGISGIFVSKFSGNSGRFSGNSGKIFRNIPEVPESTQIFRN